MSYYSLARIKKYGCLYNLIIGKRSNGKTFAALDEGLKIYKATDKKIAYIRRYKEDITRPNLYQLFDPHPITKWGGGQYDGYTYTSREFKMANSETGSKSPVICQTFSLSAWERQKGSDKGDFGVIIFDEFITRDQYLPHEVDIFLEVLSSIMRDRGGVPVYMIANTVSQFCPYFTALGIDIQKISKGEIKQVSNNCVIEYCEDNGKQGSTKYFTPFATNKAKMITTGDWDFRKYPTLFPKSHKDYNFLLRFFVVLSDRKICGEVLSDKTGAFIYFYPFTGDIRDQEHTIIYQHSMSINALHAVDFNCTTTSAHIIISDLIKNKKCYYRDNETGDGIAAFIAGSDV